MDIEKVKADLDAGAIADTVTVRELIAEVERLKTTASTWAKDNTLLIAEAVILREVLVQIERLSDCKYSEIAAREALTNLPEQTTKIQAVLDAADELVRVLHVSDQFRFGDGNSTNPMRTFMFAVQEWRGEP